MRKTIIAVGILMLLILGGLWAFFTFGGTPQKPSTSNAALLKTANKNMVKGNPEAPVKIVEYADILCPYCAKASTQTIPRIQTDYIDKNDAQFEVRLVAMIAPDSQRAAEGAYCAAEQNKFWTYIETAYKKTWDNYYSKDSSPENIPYFSQGGIQDFAKSISLDMIPWQDCMDSDRHITTLAENKKEMSQMKAYGTPHFIINEKSYSGAPPFEAFKAVIDSELRK